MTALRRNKMRSALTTLGVIIGVAAVIAMIEISQGSKTAVLRPMSTMGANKIMIRSGAAASGGISFGAGSVLTLTPDDAEDGPTRKPPPSSRRAHRANRRAGRVRQPQLDSHEHHGHDARVSQRPRLERLLGRRDVHRPRCPQCEQGVRDRRRRSSRELFDGESPIGKDIRVKNVSLRVVGVLGRKGANMMGMDQDDIVLAPWTTIKYRVADNAAAANAQTVATASSGTSTQVNTLSNLYPGATSLYPVQSATQAANTPQPIRFTNVDQIMVKAASGRSGATRRCDRSRHPARAAPHPRGRRRRLQHPRHDRNDQDHGLDVAR